MIFRYVLQSVVVAVPNFVRFGREEVGIPRRRAHCRCQHRFLLLAAYEGKILKLFFENKKISKINKFFFIEKSIVSTDLIIKIEEICFQSYERDLEAGKIALLKKYKSIHEERLAANN